MLRSGKLFVTITRLLLNQVFELAVTRLSTSSRGIARKLLDFWKWRRGGINPGKYSRSPPRFTFYCTRTIRLPVFLTEG